MANKPYPGTAPTHTSRLGEQAIREMLSRAETLIRGMWRYRWRAIAVAWTVSVLGWVAVALMPPVYKASARIFVDTDDAIKPLLEGIAATSNVLNKATIVTREILSRPNLAEVARETDLDLRARDEEAFEDLLTKLQQRIKVEGNRENIFTIAYEDPDSRKAIAVVDSLVETFVEKSLGANREDTNTAQSFLVEQIDAYERRLTEAENRLADFKRENVAYMPGQRGDYFERLQAAESTLAATRDKLRSAEERRAELRRQLEGEEPVFGIFSSGRGSAANIAGPTAAKIRQLELELSELRLQYTDKHPRIQQILDTIKLLEQEALREQAEREASGNTGAPPSQNALELNPVYQNMRIQLSNTEVEIAALRTELGQHEQQVADLKRLVDTVPQVEAELVRLNRDYDVVKSKYEQLLVQLETASIGEDIDASIDEAVFRIIEPPYAAATPVGPKRQLFMTAVFLTAIGAGGALALLMNQLHPVFFSSREITATTGLPVLGSVALVMSARERRAKKLGRLKFATAVILLLGVFFLTVVSTETISPLLRNATGLGV